MRLDCNFQIGDSVSISNRKLRVKYPFRDEYYTFITGVISDIYPEVPEVPGCFYEVKFSDGTIAVEVPENYLNSMRALASPPPPPPNGPNIHIEPNGPNDPHPYCKFKIGDKVSVSDKKLTFIKPHRREYVKFKAGIIRAILPTRPSLSYCLYEVQFRDGSIATEVSEHDLRKSIEIIDDTNSPISTPWSFNPINTTDSETQTDNRPYYPNPILPISPKQSDSKSDILTLIALNNLNETLRDSLKPTNILYSPYLESPFLKQEIQNIGNDEDLQDDVTEYYHNKTLKWIQNEHEFKKAKKHLKFIKSKKGLPYINKVLKSFVKKFDKNWYELRDDETKDDVQEYIRMKLVSL